ncbi:MAG TPA: YmdB family metallophosphoesterase [Gaiellales bacterium]|nr:YmdB family metallophosphoesterase [Gaiellales bacterium]
MAYITSEARRDLLDDIARATDEIANALAALGAAYEQLDDATADRLEEQLFRPVQAAYGRARRTHSGFAGRHGLPGRDFTVPESAGPPSQGVRGFMERARDAIAEADAILAELRDSTDAVLIDMHAEATSEKVALGWHLDGRVLAVVGTHTHIPTADARVLPGGTAYVTDVGMTGPRGGVIGVKKELAIQRFLTLTQVRFETSQDDPWLNGVLVEAGPDGKATSIRQLLVPATEQ